MGSLDIVRCDDSIILRRFLQSLENLKSDNDLIKMQILKIKERLKEIENEKRMER